MWIFCAFLVHVLLLGSILVNFRSTVIQDLQPQPPLLAYALDAPASRLVIFATDGLRAASFFEDNCHHVPHLREIFMREGLVGISRTRTPTESRPGHIALLAGFYEDPSAVFTGWKRNPVQFDSLLNHSGYSFSWGCPDIMGVFESVTKRGGGVLFHSFDDKVYESARWATYRLDEWVFSQVSVFLDHMKNKWSTSSPVVFFLHLPSTDRAGHVHKPATSLFHNSLNITDHGIWEMYQQFEETFPDKQTVYLLTSDHGMTDTGIHGSGTQHETETPFMLWGAGVSRTASTVGTRKFVANDEGVQLPLHELEQAQLTPLMSALIGLPPPMNNFGILPTGYMAVSEEYEAMAAHSNALQLLAQYEKLLEQHRKGLFADILNNFDELSQAEIDAYKQLIVKLHSKRAYAKSLTRSNVVMELTLKGIDYYHGYYRNCLLLSTTATFLGWIFYLYRLLSRNSAGKLQIMLERQEKVSRVTLDVSMFLLLFFLVAQRTPIAIAFYLLLPLPVWMMALKPKACGTSSVAVPISQPGASALTSASQLLLIIVCAELMVFTFFERRLISVCFVAFGCYNNWRNFVPNSREFYSWLALVVILACFPFLPLAEGYQNWYLFLAGVVLVLLKEFWFKKRRSSYSYHTKYCNAVILLNTVICAYLDSEDYDIPIVLYVANWSFLIYAFVSIMRNKESNLEDRLAQICFNLGSLHALLSTSYESVFVQLLTMELSLSLTALNVNSRQSVLCASFSILLYTLFSFFGMETLKSLDLFDSNSGRCFIGKYAPFVTMGLVLLKHSLPVVVNLSILHTHCEYVRKRERKILICMLIICNIMGLNFLYLVRNQGSWAEMGASIIHFNVVGLLPVVHLLSWAAQLLLGLIAIVLKFQ
ncbi:GPI ethanolamine phosphate transferase 1-like [Drosophila guanche]|uniref:GPI ethanolamine phosphate transferase 1 n=1 Tax=Drosophila guanche TaxID=7266 RepID=A0A3B0IZI2_DROGU|nr:GPI ethanolamine phosphate transferase 1-like [Drosophila guanche]SPP73615.1 blast:GPI ethanolamine phosphate transferase 1 [Drosophila guanche]